MWRWPFPIASMLGSSSAIVFGWKVYGDDAPKYVGWFHGLFKRCRDAKYWVLYRLHPRHRYHIVKTDLGYGYHCQDTRILHAAMACLCEYVEAEGGEVAFQRWTDELLDRTKNDPNAPDGFERDQGNRQAEVLAIYRWWKIERPADQKRSDELLHLLYGGEDRISWKETENPRLSEMVFEPFKGNEVALNEEFRNLEKKIVDDEQKMLRRLVEVRQSLWT